MDPALKQRLLGAVVLIALAIIFVPMMFSGSAPKTDSVTANLEIPPVPTREFETRVLTVDGAGSATENVPAQPAQAPERLAPEATPVPTPAVEPAKPATPAQMEAGKGAEGRYLVHLGVYTATGNAQDLVATLKKSGFAAFSESVDFKGKPALRVRVGPFGDRAEAEAARIRIKQVRSDVPSSVSGLRSIDRMPRNCVTASRKN